MNTSKHTSNIKSCKLSGWLSTLVQNKNKTNPVTNDNEWHQNVKLSLTKNRHPCHTLGVNVIRITAVLPPATADANSYYVEKTFQFINLCNSNNMKCWLKTAKVNLGLNHHVLSYNENHQVCISCQQYKTVSINRISMHCVHFTTAHKLHDRTYNTCMWRGSVALCMDQLRGACVVSSEWIHEWCSTEAICRRRSFRCWTANS